MGIFIYIIGVIVSFLIARAIIKSDKKNSGGPSAEDFTVVCIISLFSWLGVIVIGWVWLMNDGSKKLRSMKPPKWF